VLEYIHHKKDKEEDKEDLSMLKTILECGADVDLQDSNG